MQTNAKKRFKVSYEICFDGFSFECVCYLVVVDSAELTLWPRGSCRVAFTIALVEAFVVVRRPK